jgi:hypothetical protein
MRVLFVLCAACGSSGGSSSVDAGPGAIDAMHVGSGSNAIDGGGTSKLISTLTSSCATLQGRAIVNYNDNLGIVFTESDSPYTFLGSVQFQLPDGFTGSVPNPEIYDPNSDRHIAAMTTPDFDLHGNHCWMNIVPPSGTLVVDEFQPSAGVVKATFSSYPLHSCTGATVCTVSGKIETTGSGVFTP